jgi:cytochrome c553
MKTLLHPLLKNFSTLAVTGLLATSALAEPDTKPAPSVNIKAKVAMCIGCHGIPGYQASFPEVYKVPMISGQNAKFITASLEAYRKGDRKHPTMKAIAGSLTDQDIGEVAAYYEADGKDVPVADAGKTAPVASAEVQALLTKGNCLSCHGEGLNKPIDASYPKLAGQHADYLYVALKAYQTTDNAKIGRSNPIMAAQAKLFTHAELKKLAAYASSLPGGLKTVPQSKLHKH